MANSTNTTDATSWPSWGTLTAGTYIFLLALNILLSITASLGNSLILIALYKVSSIYPPTKRLFGCLAVTDLCVGLISQPLYNILLLMSAGYIDDIAIYSTYSAVEMFFFYTLSVVSVLTSVVISVDRLLALMLHLSYKHLVTLRRVRVVIGCVWSFAVLIGALYTAAWIAFFDIQFEFLNGIFFGLIILSIAISTFCYTKIFFTLRKQQTQVQNHVQPGQQNGEGNPLNIARYKKTVLSIAWVQLALLICYAPYTITLMIVWYGNIAFTTVIPQAVALEISLCLLYLNSSLNPILYCWRIRAVRKKVKKILRKGLPVKLNSKDGPTV